MKKQKFAHLNLFSSSATIKLSMARNKSNFSCALIKKFYDCTLSNKNSFDNPMVLLQYALPQMISACFRAEKVGWMAVLKIRSGPSVKCKNQILLQFPRVLNHIIKEP